VTTSQVREKKKARTPVRPSPPATPWISWQKLTCLPLALVIALLTTLVLFRRARLDPVARNAMAHGRVTRALWQHLELTAIATVLVLVVAIPLGILLTRASLRRATPVALTIATLGRAVPALGLLAPPLLWLGTGPKTVLLGVVVYAVLPVLATTIAGLAANDPALLKAARGLGMSPLGVLARVELPAAVPLILAGVRTAMVLNVGTVTLAALGGGGGLGVLVTTGLTRHCVPVLVLGSILTVALALLLDWLVSVAELLVRPRFAERD